MTRTIDGALVTSLQSASAETCALVEMQFASGTLRIATAGQNVSALSQTWTAIGGALSVEQINETVDNRGNGVPIALSGVDQAMLALLLGENFAGRRVRIWWVHFNRSTGAVIGTPLLLHDGLMLEDWEWEEVPGSEDEPGTVTIRTRLMSRYAQLLKRRGVLCSVHEHQRAIGAAAAGDTFFMNVPKIVGQTYIWGRIPSRTGGRAPGPTVPGPGGPTGYPGHP